MGRYAWVFVLVVIVWQVIAAIAQNAAKKQQRDKMSDLAKTRRGQTSAGPSATGPTMRPPTSTSSTPFGGTAGARATDLAARRKAQLEELRRRRGAATDPSGGAASGSPRQARVDARLGRPTTPSPLQPTPARPTPRSATPTPARQRKIRSVDADFRSVRAAEERAQRERQEDQQREVRAGETQRRRREVEEQERLASRLATRRSTGMAEVQDDAYAKRRDRHSASAARLRALLGDVQTLRDLYVIKEVLEPPIALRPTRV